MVRHFNSRPLNHQAEAVLKFMEVAHSPDVVVYRDPLKRALDAACEHSGSDPASIYRWVVLAICDRKGELYHEVREIAKLKGFDFRYRNPFRPLAKG